MEKTDKRDEIQLILSTQSSAALTEKVMKPEWLVLMALNTRSA